MTKSIPKLVHQIWFQGIDQNIPEPYNKSYKSCVKKFKEWDWQHKLWDKNSIEKLLNKYPNYKKKYDKLELRIQKIDFAKYVIMYHYGGVYIDMDMECLKDIYKLIDKDDELIVSKMSISLMYSNGIFFSIPKNKFWKDLINKIDTKTYWWRKILPSMNISLSVGNLFFTKFFDNYKGKKKLLDYKYLEGCETKYNCEYENDMYLKDNLANHWLSWYESLAIRIYSIRKMIFYLVIILLLILLFKKNQQYY